MNLKQYKGAGTALITPFNNKDEIDFPALEKLLEFQVLNRIDYIVLLGTTAESVTLDKNEKQEIINFAAKVVNKRVPLVAGFGGCNTKEIINSIESFDLENIDALLSVSPYYNKPNQEGIYRHYSVIANASPLPIILYNVPSRTGSNIEAATTLKLANEFENIIAIKEASGDFAQCMNIIENKPDNFLLISGDDLNTLALLGIGFNGVVSVISNAFPSLFTQMVHHSLNEEFKKAGKIHYKLSKMMQLIFADNSPGGIKALLNHKGLCENILRLPLTPVNSDLENIIRKEAEKIEL